MAYYREHAIPTRIVRIFNTYGPRMRLRDGRVVPAFISQALAGQPMTVFGDGKQTRSFCYCSDLIDGIFRLMICPEKMMSNLTRVGYTSIIFSQYILNPLRDQVVWDADTVTRLA